MDKPTNHVTQRLREAVTKSISEGRPAPDVTLAFVLWLQEVYPPRCYRPSQETLEEHLKYAGAVDLVAGLAAQQMASTKDITTEEEDAIIDQYLKEQGVLPA